MATKRLLITIHVPVFRTFDVDWARSTLTVVMAEAPVFGLNTHYLPNFAKPTK